MNPEKPWEDTGGTVGYWPKAPVVHTGPNRAQRRALTKPKTRPVYGGRTLIGNPICTKETYDGTPFSAQVIGKPTIGPHHVRNVFKRLRRERRAAA